MKLINKALSCLLIITVFSTLIGCEKEQTTKENIIYDSASSIYSLDPQLAEDTFHRELAYNLFEGLLKFDANGEVRLAAASSYKTENDGLRYIFEIDKTKRWSNGEKLTAYDFEYGFKKAFLKNLNAPYLTTMLPIKNAEDIINGNKSYKKLGVKAKNKHTLVIDLEYRSDAFLEVLASPICSPCNEEFFNSTKGYYGLRSKYIITNGQYAVAAWNEKYCLLKSNDEYYNAKKSNLKNIYIYFNDYETVLENLKNKDSDYTVIDSSRLYEFEKQDIKTEKQVMGNTVYSILINEDKEYFNSKIKKALLSTLSLEIDENLSDCGVSAATTILPEVVDKSDKIKYKNTKTKYKDEAFDLFLEGCRELNIERIFPTINITYIENTITTNIAKQIAANWQNKFGITVNITQVKTRDELANFISENTFDVAIIPSSASSNSPVAYLRQFTSSSNLNCFKFKNSKFDEGVNKLDRLSGEKFINKAEDLLKIISKNKNLSVIYTDSIVFLTPNGTEFSINPKYKVTDYSKF